uniref:uncharacterized protein LOC112431652 n=1 Tax=Maylandia zebra TaxID=106582 RepID=UPI000D2FA93E|nr:uncharacterized protein LOC112431652 [Maylandia zebra]
MYPCGSTALERSLLQDQLAVRYQVMKRKWQHFLPSAMRMRLNGTDAELLAAVRYFDQRQAQTQQQSQDRSEAVRVRMAFLELQAQILFERVTFDREELQEAIRIIDKDVPRTNRDLSYYQVEAALLKNWTSALCSSDERQHGEYVCHRWLLLGFQREFEHSEALRLFEILRCDHLELISQQVDRARYQERVAQKFSTEDGSESELQAINTDFTFELFICAAILLEHRESLLQCPDDFQLLQYTNGLQGTLDLNSILKKAELISTTTASAVLGILRMVAAGLIGATRGLFLSSP